MPSFQSSKIHSRFLGTEAPDDSIDIGIEVEVEGVNLPNLRNKFWRTEHDGSLRGESFEYVTNPLTYDNYQEALERLQKRFEETQATFNQSDRTGTHVHFNVQHLTMLELANLLCVYYILEDAIVSICGENRVGNHFCLRMSDAPVITDYLLDVYTHGDVGFFRTDDLRYSALNTQALFRYGTLEFRAIQTDLSFIVLNKIVGIMRVLIDNCRNFRNPKEILETFSGNSVEIFLRMVFQNNEKWAEELNVDPDRMMSAVRRIQDFVYQIQWENENNG